MSMKYISTVTGLLQTLRLKRVDDPALGTAYQVVSDGEIPRGNLLSYEEVKSLQQDGLAAYGN